MCRADRALSEANRSAHEVAASALAVRAAREMCEGPNAVADPASTWFAMGEWHRAALDAYEGHLREAKLEGGTE